MEYRTLGKTGLEVSIMGVGLAEIGFNLTFDDVARVTRVLNLALDHGVNLLDTAACYGISEELVGRSVADRRRDFVLSTKCGHVPSGLDDEEWTGPLVTASIDHSLKLMRTDHLDIVHLHSCTVDILERGEVIEALEAAKRAGKTRFIAYSGDNAPAQWAVESGRFDVLQTSFNLVDQRAKKRLLPAAARAGMGVIAKRPIANGAWQVEGSPSEYAAPYFARSTAMLAEGPIDSLSNEQPDPVETALSYVLSFPSVSTAIVGTSNPIHMLENIQHLTAVPDFSQMVIAELNKRFDRLGTDWEQLT